MIYNRVTKFFESKKNSKVNLKIPFLFVVLTSILGAISILILFRNTFLSTPSENLKTLMITGFIFASIFGTIIGLIGYFIETTIFNLTAVILGGKGNFKKLLELFGYTYIVTIISSLIGLIIAIGYAPHISYMQFQQNSTIFKNVIGNLLIFKISHYINYLFGFIKLLLMVLGIKVANGLSIRKSFIVIFIPSFMFIIITQVLIKSLEHLLYVGG